VLFSLLLLTACTKPLPVLDNFNAARWKDDRHGCLGDRKKMMESLQEQKEKLLALKEMQIVSLLGRPDGNELYERNQKFYSYSITPSASCLSADSLIVRLEIRFNALGVAKEVLIQ
jgi:hypothetical protein